MSGVMGVCSRALEASAEESAAWVKRKRCEAQGESCSPAEWIRQEEWPVGIRNVGNTCWFSAVIQVRSCCICVNGYHPDQLSWVSFLFVCTVKQNKINSVYLHRLGKKPNTNSFQTWKQVVILFFKCHLKTLNGVSIFSTISKHLLWYYHGGLRSQPNIC